ncbi:hypothetical protein HPB48_019071 [Haemaphysalis longicornis]|uniref:ATP-dependent RNA helicase n=1 Tax=Haemaphysalis longicornis TaxID=44386 RepID=A0A9J6GKX8_HAELO|nr:hypothetical protein HPB48_019071 [Haemaphysalis longicornis]
MYPGVSCRYARLSIDVAIGFRHWSRTPELGSVAPGGFPPAASLAGRWQKTQQLIRHSRQRRQPQHQHHHFQQNVTLGLNPGSYQESGPWGPWTTSSSCSRTCGGGVAYQTRVCEDFRSCNRFVAIGLLPHVAMDDSSIVLNLNTDFQPRRKPFATPAAAAAAATFHRGAPKKPPSVPVIRKPIAPRTTPTTGGSAGTALNKRNRHRQTNGPSDGDAQICRSEQPTRKKAKDFVQASSLFDGRASLAEPEPVQQTTVVDAKNEPVFSSSQFADISVHPHLVSCLRDRFQITTATEVQKLAIPSLLMHRDTLIKSHTGSDLRVFREAEQGLHLACSGRPDGRRERKCEKARLRKGLAMVVRTPGRRTDHLEHTKSFSLSKTAWMVIDEVDRMLELGFEESVAKIVTL